MPQGMGESQAEGAESCRVRVRGPQRPPTADEALMGLARGHLRSAGSAEAQGDAVRALKAAQLKLALAVAAMVFTVLAGAFLALEVFALGGSRSAAGVPLNWAVPVLLLGPLTVSVGWWYLRAAHRVEEDFLARTGVRTRPPGPDSAEGSPTGGEPGGR